MRNNAGTTTGLLGGLAILATLLGCQATQQQRARQEAMSRWNVTRAQVKAQLASNQFDAGNITGAATELAEAQQLDPANPRLIPLRVRVLLAEGKTTQADALLEGARADGHADAEIEYLVGVVRQQQLRLDDALEAYLHATELNETEVAYVVAAAQAWLQLGQPRDALTFLDEKSPRFGWTNAYQAILAECHEQLGNWSTAASAWQHVVYGQSDDPEIRARLGEALYRSHRYVEAVPVFVGLIEDDPAKAPAWMRLMLAECYVAEGRGDVARAEAQHVLQTEPENTGALRMLARCYGATGEYGPALRVARRALSIDPSDAHTLELTAALAWRAGDRNLATLAANRLLEIDPGNAVAESILQRMQIPDLTGEPTPG